MKRCRRQKTRRPNFGLPFTFWPSMTFFFSSSVAMPREERQHFKVKVKGGTSTMLQAFSSFVIAHVKFVPVHSDAGKHSPRPCTSNGRIYHNYSATGEAGPTQNNVASFFSWGCTYERKREGELCRAPSEFMRAAPLSLYFCYFRRRCPWGRLLLSFVTAHPLAGLPRVVL